MQTVSKEVIVLKITKIMNKNILNTILEWKC